MFISLISEFCLYEVEIYDKKIVQEKRQFYIGYKWAKWWQRFRPLVSMLKLSHIKILNSKCGILADRLRFDHTGYCVFTFIFWALQLLRFGSFFFSLRGLNQTVWSIALLTLNSEPYIAKDSGQALILIEYITIRH